MNFKDVTLTVNYPETDAEAAIPADLTLDQLIQVLRSLCSSEPEMTSFVLVATVSRTTPV